MKKPVLIILLLSFSFAFAQFEEKSGSQFKPEGGDMNLELSVNPGSIFGSGSGSTFGFIQNSIKFRSFSSSFKAFRMGVGVNYSNDIDIIQEADDDTNDLELKSYSSRYSVSFMPGFEKHFEGTKRLSPYTGLQFLLSYSHTSYREEFQVDNKVYNSTLTNVPGGAGGNGNGGLSVGVGFVAGFDYYFAKKLYLGVELGIGAEYMKVLDSKYTNTYEPNFDTSMKNGSKIILSPGLSTTGLRLGWIF